MKKNITSVIAVILTIIIMLTGCASNSTAENSEVSENFSAEMAQTVQTAAGSIENDYLVTNVYGDGQKPWFIVLEYSKEIDPQSVSIDAFTVQDYEVTAVYTNTEASIPTESVAGKYVLIELSTDYTNAGYNVGGESPSGEMSGPPSEEMSGTSENTDGASAENSIDAPQGKGPNGGMGAGGFMQAEPSNQLSVTWTQVGEIKGVDGTVFAAAGASNTTDYNNNVNLFVDNFEQMTFTSEDGTSIMYNLYLPEGYEENTAYPLVLFMPDATGEGSDQYLTLTESLGPIVWTTEESQADNPCIVLAPQYESTNSSDPAYTMELLHSIIEQYSVDINRLYLVGQSSGTIRSIKLMIENPDTFAGAMLVAGQAETEYVDRISELANQNIWMICSAGDERAYPGMTAIVEAVEAEGTTVTTAQWSAKLSEDEQNTLAEEMKKAGTTINFTVFDAGTVMQDDVTVNSVSEHMNTWRVAYNITTIREWLFEQTND